MNISNPSKPLPIMVSWSSGKDSAWSLHLLRQQPELYEVRGIFTTVNVTFDRIAIHSTPRWVLQLQAERLGVPLFQIPIPSPCTNQQYEAAMQKFLDGVQALPESETVEHLAFGDLFLEDIRAYREDKLSGTGFTPVFPVWGSNTTELAETMIESGIRAVITAGDSRIPSRLVGSWFDRDFLASIPDSVDPLGENGEFHTCVLDGPMFSSPIQAEPGQIVVKEIPPITEDDGIHTPTTDPIYITYADIIAL